VTEEGRKRYEKMTTAEERVPWFEAMGLFPVCGHHRVEASLALAAELNDAKWKIWQNVKIVATPAGRSGRTT